MQFRTEQAIKLFKNKNYEKSYNEFWSLSYFYEAGYCKFAQGNYKIAEKIWSDYCIDSPAVNWGLNAIKLIELTIPKKLTFFQIRNFLERDLALLMDNGHLTEVENIISAKDILAEYNPEAYKFIARVLLNNGYPDISKDFLMKAHSICYSDAEVHHLLARYYLSVNDTQNAIKILNIALSINPEYFPVKNLLELIELEI